MTITISKTDQVVEAQGGIKCRVWEGQTAKGVRVQVLVPRIAALDEGDLGEFESELQEVAPPPQMARAFPLRMIL